MGKCKAQYPYSPVATGVEPPPGQAVRQSVPIQSCVVPVTVLPWTAPTALKDPLVPNDPILFCAPLPVFIGAPTFPLGADADGAVQFARAN